MKFSSNPNTKCTKKPQCSISTKPFSDVPSQKYLNPQIRTNKLVNSIFYHPCPSRLASGDTSFHISLNSLGFYISRMFAEFSLPCIFQPVWEKFFKLWCSHS